MGTSPKWLKIHHITLVSGYWTPDKLINHCMTSETKPDWVCDSLLNLERLLGLIFLQLPSLNAQIILQCAKESFWLASLQKVTSQALETPNLMVGIIGCIMATISWFLWWWWSHSRKELCVLHFSYDRTGECCNSSFFFSDYSTFYL